MRSPACYRQRNAIFPPLIHQTWPEPWSRALYHYAPGHPQPTVIFLLSHCTKRVRRETCRLDDMEYTNLDVGECECVGSEGGERGGKEKGKDIRYLFSMDSQLQLRTRPSHDNEACGECANSLPSPSLSGDGWMEGALDSWTCWGPPDLKQGKSKAG